MNTPPVDTTEAAEAAEAVADTVEKYRNAVDAVLDAATATSDAVFTLKTVAGKDNQLTVAAEKLSDVIADAEQAADDEEQRAIEAGRHSDAIADAVAAMTAETDRRAAELDGRAASETTHAGIVEQVEKRRGDPAFRARLQRTIAENSVLLDMLAQ